MSNKESFQRWTVTVEEDPVTGDLLLPLPQNLLDQYGWKEGDHVKWTDNKDGSWSLSITKRTFFQRWLDWVCVKLSNGRSK
jgi:hypothetical protein